LTSASRVDHGFEGFKRRGAVRVRGDVNIDALGIPLGNPHGFSGGIALITSNALIGVTDYY
jgi:hypothetical protein